MHPELKPRQLASSAKRINNAIVDALGKGDRVELRGFGTFFLSKRPARQLRNPLNGDKVFVPQRAVPRFKAGKSFKRHINEAATDKM